MERWKAQLSFKQYVPLQASKFGIKTYRLCGSTSGYLWSPMAQVAVDRDNN